MIRLSSAFLNAPTFALGQILVTPGALDAVGQCHQNLLVFLGRHSACDWGEVCEGDHQLNEQALQDGSRLLSAYTTKSGTKLWIITEAADDTGERATTTILLP